MPAISAADFQSLRDSNGGPANQKRRLSAPCCFQCFLPGCPGAFLVCPGGPPCGCAGCGFFLTMTVDFLVGGWDVVTQDVAPTAIPAISNNGRKKCFTVCFMARVFFVCTSGINRHRRDRAQS